MPVSPRAELPGAPPSGRRRVGMAGVAIRDPIGGARVRRGAGLRLVVVRRVARAESWAWLGAGAAGRWAPAMRFTWFLQPQTLQTPKYFGIDGNYTLSLRFTSSSIYTSPRSRSPFIYGSYTLYSISEAPHVCMSPPPAPRHTSTKSEVHREQHMRSLRHAALNAAHSSELIHTSELIQWRAYAEEHDSCTPPWPFAPAPSLAPLPCWPGCGPAAPR